MPNGSSNGADKPASVAVAARAFSLHFSSNTGGLLDNVFSFFKSSEEGGLSPYAEAMAAGLPAGIAAAAADAQHSSQRSGKK